MSDPTCTIQICINSFAFVSSAELEGAYIGTGDVLKFDESTYDDNTYPINCSWTTKTLDFVDQHEDMPHTTLYENPKVTQYWKTISKATLFYEDISASAPVTISASNDGGLTWLDRSVSVGVGDGKQKTQDFFFRDDPICTGQDFVFRISCGAFAGTFSWTGLLIDYNMRGPYFQVAGY